MLGLLAPLTIQSVWYSQPMKQNTDLFSKNVCVTSPGRWLWRGGEVASGKASQHFSCTLRGHSTSPSLFWPEARSGHSNRKKPRLHSKLVQAKEANAGVQHAKAGPALFCLDQDALNARVRIFHPSSTLFCHSRCYSELAFTLPLQYRFHSRLKRSARMHDPLVAGLTWGARGGGGRVARLLRMY